MDTSPGSFSNIATAADLFTALQNNGETSLCEVDNSAIAGAARQKDKDGWLPIHLALKDKVSAEIVVKLLALYPEASREKSVADPTGRFPLHLACANQAPLSVVSALMNQYPEAVRIKNENNGLLPLQIACGNKSSVEVIKALLAAYPEAAREKNSVGSLSLHLTCQFEASSEAILAVLASYPEAAGVKDDYWWYPLQLLCQKQSISIECIEKLFAAYPEAARSKTIMRDYPVHLAKAGYNSDEVLGTLLAHQVMGPHGISSEGLPDFIHDHGERYIDAVEIFLDKCITILPELMKLPDLSGRTAMGVANSKCRAAIMQRILLCSRFELGEQVHSSVTSRVFFALDYGQSSTNPPRVALKFIRHREHFQTEITARQEAAAAKEHFLPIIATYNADDDSSFEKMLIAHRRESHRYLVVMPAGDRSLESAIVAESAEASWPSDAHRATREAAEALAALHAAGFAHGDVKPRNILRVGAHFKLIDFDSASALGAAHSGKLSTAYAPPEAFLVDSSSGAVSRNHKLISSPAVDAWALGVTLYRALRNSTLVRVVADDADGDSELRVIAEWTLSSKNARLASVSDVKARNLISQLLHRDPAMRPSLAQALQHSYFTQKEALRMPGDNAFDWDVFISYRVASDQPLAAALHESLSTAGLRVFWDKVCLVTGKEWRDGFFDGLVKSRLFLPVISRGAIKTVNADNKPVWGNWELLNPDSPCDNKLLEHRAALECRDRGLLDYIVPVFVGDEVAADTPGYRGSYFAGGCCPQASGEVVESIEAELCAQLDRTNLGTPYVERMTVRAVLDRIKGFQAVFLERNTEDALRVVCEEVLKLLRPPREISSDGLCNVQNDFTNDRDADIDQLTARINSTGMTDV
jgi:serine/threonine protein kinase